MVRWNCVRHIPRPMMAPSPSVPSRPTNADTASIVPGGGTSAASATSNQCTRLTMLHTALVQCVFVSLLPLLMRKVGPVVGRAPAAALVPVRMDLPAGTTTVCLGATSS